MQHQARTPPEPPQCVQKAARSQRNHHDSAGNSHHQVRFHALLSPHDLKTPEPKPRGCIVTIEPRLHIWHCRRVRKPRPRGGDEYERPSRTELVTTVNRVVLIRGRASVEKDASVKMASKSEERLANMISTFFASVTANSEASSRAQLDLAWVKQESKEELIVERSHEARSLSCWMKTDASGFRVMISSGEEMNRSRTEGAELPRSAAVESPEFVMNDPLESLGD
ncbi:hypothetical protein EPI10_014642 [Gossypium australe]|uniref:Uncharacterized protein n=1 Tax=Gossypium australe TaxID=47621 RepID=A0A5B6VIA3_9ROSI|nr:hypothetical protein EPI10_014642 [Gossypium australe]